MPPKMDECTISQPNLYISDYTGSRFAYTNTITSSPELTLRASVSEEDLKKILNPENICYTSSKDCANYKKPDPPKVNSDEIIRRAHQRKYTPKKIIYNPPATIVFWEDGTKTVVKCAEGETYSEYYGFLAALGKKIFGTNSEINRIVKTHIPKVKEAKPKTYSKLEEKPVTFRDAKGRYAKAEKKTKKKEQKKK